MCRGELIDDPEILTYVDPVPGREYRELHRREDTMLGEAAVEAMLPRVCRLLENDLDLAYSIE